jgi:hypothetical protein
MQQPPEPKHQYSRYKRLKLAEPKLNVRNVIFRLSRNPFFSQNLAANG